MALDRFSRSVLTGKALVLFAIAGYSVGASPLSVAYAQSAGAPEWTTSSYNPQRDAWQRDETKITPQNVKNLKLLWKVKVASRRWGCSPFGSHYWFRALRPERGQESGGDGWGRE